MQKAHDASKNDYWKNKPNITTPIIAEQLNRMETSMDVIDDRVVLFDTTKANQSDLLTCVASITYSTSTGILTITLKNGTSTTIDTGLAKLSVNFDYDDDPTSAHYEQLIITMADGTKKYVDMSALITQFEFVNTSTIAWTVESDGTVKANVVNGSITAEKLQPNYLADVTAQATIATNASTSASANALVAEGYAKGTQNGQPVQSGSPYFENNAEYFKNQARAIVGNKVDTFNGRTGTVTPQAHDYDASQVDFDNTAIHGFQSTNVQHAIQEAVFLLAGMIDETIELNPYNVDANAWVANTDTNTNAKYPYVAVILTTDYASTDTPTWGMYGVNGIPTDDESEAIDLIEYADFGADNGTKIILYATDQPEVALVLKAKGH